MSNILLLNQSSVEMGLVTMTFSIPSTGLYNVKADITEIPPSGLVVVVKQNGSTVFTAPVITPTQSALQFKYDLNAVAADAIQVVLSSPSAIDALYNSVKSIISIGQGY